MIPWYDLPVPKNLNEFLARSFEEYSGDYTLITGDMYDTLDRLDADRYDEYVFSEPPVFPEGTSLLQKCMIAGYCDWFWCNLHPMTFKPATWTDDPGYIHPTPVLPLEGKYPELNMQYAIAGHPAFKRHNIYLFDQVIRRA